MRRVVVTGLGIVSPIGNNAAEVEASLRAGKSGIEANADMAERGFRSQIAGNVKIDVTEHVDKRALRFMGPGAAYAYISMQQAIEDAGLSEDQVSNTRTGLIAGSGGPSTSAMYAAHQIVDKNNSPKRIGPFAVPKCMSSTISANLSTPFKIKGINYSITSACATSAHCIGAAAEQIQLGKQDIVFAGGGEEEHWNLTSMFDAMGALSTKYNDEPTKASRPYDTNRDGFVSAAGSGMVVVEELEHAKGRGAKIYAEIVGYHTGGSGEHVSQSNGASIVHCLRETLASAKLLPGDIDYISAHGTATRHGDEVEAKAIAEVFGDTVPVSSLKGYIGHTLGASGALELIVSLAVMKKGVIYPTRNLDTVDEACRGIDHVREPLHRDVSVVMKNCFAFGGINAALVCRRPEC